MNSTFMSFIYKVEGESSKITSHLECLTRHTTNTSNTQKIKQKHEKKKSDPTKTSREASKECYTSHFCKSPVL